MLTLTPITLEITVKMLACIRIDPVKKVILADLWTFRPLDDSPSGRFATWTFRPYAMDDSPPNSIGLVLIGN